MLVLSASGARAPARNRRAQRSPSDRINHRSSILASKRQAILTAYPNLQHLSLIGARVSLDSPTYFEARTRIPSIEMLPHSAYTMHPYASPTQIHQTKAQSLWPRLIDWLCWLYRICFAVTAIGTTKLLRASSISVGPMQYDFYFEKARSTQQLWYKMTLMLIILTPVAAFLGPWLQLAWQNRPMRQRFLYVGVTVATWLVAFSALLIAGVPIGDFLFD